MNRTHLIVGLIVVSSLLAPSMICLIPGAMLTAAEAECCRQMGPNCGDTAMSHSCCKIWSSSGEMKLIAEAKSKPLVTEQTAVGNLAGIGLNLQGSRIENTLAAISLPLSPHLNSIAILRI